MGRLAAVAVLAALQSSGGLHQQALAAEGPEKLRAVAWLISGQMSRFIYKDSARFLDGGIQGLSGCTDYAKQGAICPIVVDVHIALADTHVSGFRGNQYELPKYGAGAFTRSAIVAHYKAFGAHDATVRIVSGNQFEEDVKGIRVEFLAQAKAMSHGEPAPLDGGWHVHGVNVQERSAARLEQNGNMMYLRHLAYSSAVETEKNMRYKYTHVLYTREDNVFVHPPYTLLQLARDMDNGADPSASPASVLVDKHCGWGGFYSDKLYFASRKGIDILFARRRAEHISQMAQWINMALTATEYKDPLKTEEYFKRLLDGAHANVTKFEFMRFDARYVEGASEPCIPEIYRKCSQTPLFAACPAKTQGSSNFA